MSYMFAEYAISHALTVLLVFRMGLGIVDLEYEMDFTTLKLLDEKPLVFEALHCLLWYYSMT